MADVLGVSVRTIKNWEKEGVPEFGLARIGNVLKLLTSQGPPNEEAR